MRILFGTIFVLALSVCDARACEPENSCPPASTEELPQSPPRQRPGEDPRPTVFDPRVYESIPDISSSASDFVPVPDRWRQFYVGKLYDPYNQNILKGDIPLFGEPGHEWFLELSLTSDTLFERRVLPLPVGGASTGSPGNNNTFGNGWQSVAVQSIVPSFALIRGNTTFMPPEWEIRVVPVLNFNHAEAEETGVLRADPARGETRDDFHLGFQELFVDKHLVNLSDRYDFLSLRAGIQRFNADFRGFVYNDDQPGVRLFGNWDNNRWQYNLAWFPRLDKDVNSGVNSNFEFREEHVILLNAYRQDAITLGQSLQGNIIYRFDNAGGERQYEENGFLVRPAPVGDERGKKIDSVYAGVNTDGHIGRINTTGSLYFVGGTESHNSIAGRGQDIAAGMAALELSYDQDWVRFRSSVFWASGDDDPFDGTAHGFDAINDTPNFAGGDLAFWQRQGIPLIGGGGVMLVNRGSLIPSLRAGKEQGQSNFVNPGLRLVNLGVDFEVTPKLKIVTNASYLHFDDTATLEVLREDGSIDSEIGYDLSIGAIYRPFLNNNVQVRAGGAALIAGSGTKNLFNDDVLYDVFGNVILQY